MPSVRLARIIRSHVYFRPLNAVRRHRSSGPDCPKSPARRRCSEISELAVRGWTLAAYIVLGFGLPALAADKVDVVTLRNGDRITCDIKKLDRSVLTISTDPLGTVTVHWGDIATLASPRQFDLQLASGEHYLGALTAAAPGQIDIALDTGGSLSFSMRDIVRLAPIGASMWSRMDGGIDAGFSFTQADLETHWTLNGSATYRSPRYLLSANLSSQVTIREDAD